MVKFIKLIDCFSIKRTILLILAVVLASFHWELQNKQALKLEWMFITIGTYT